MPFIFRIHDSRKALVEPEEPYLPGEYDPREYEVPVTPVTPEILAARREWDAVERLTFYDGQGIA